MVLMAMSILFMPLVYGQQSLGVNIFQITPAELNGIVGQSVNLQGTIYTSNGTYQVYLGRTLVATNKAEGFYVNSNFTVPELPAGTHQITLRDAAININATQRFDVKTAYSINAVPKQAQEGNSVTLNVTVTGGQAGIGYNAEVSVVLPSPLSTKYSKAVNLGTPNQKGTAQAQITFPDSNFQPEGSVTHYVGTYNIHFNQSDTLASDQFTVSFIDSTEYNRGQTMNIRATGYQPNTEATISISGPKGTIHTETVTSSAEGVISATWVVSSESAIGDHTISINPQGTQKAIPDSQSFKVVGYSVKIKTVNLAGQAVPEVTIKALDASTNAVYEGTSGSDGIANLKLEKGSYVLTAFWNDVNVGQTNITITGEGSFTLQCNLASLKVNVKNTDGVAMPFVDLEFNYRYSTSGGSSQTGSASGKTDPSGSYTLTSALTGVSYTISASMYNQVFNSGNNTLGNLPNQVSTEVTIICPNRALQLEVVDYNRKIIPDARIELVELTNGLFYADTTDSSGIISNNVTFGTYRARVYKEDTLISETIIEAFSDTQQQIRATLYGIQISVSVVDFFGQAIPNANITLNGPGNARRSAMTQGDGKATFTNVIGGDMQIVAFASGYEDTYQAITVKVQEPTSLQVKIDKYVAFGSMLIQVSTLLTVAIIIAAVVLLLVVEIYRRKRAKPASEK